MTNRCIMLFPKFTNMDIIDRIREQYDPAARLVPPHITLVFPFESDISTAALSAHITGALAAASPFEVVLSNIAPAPDRYLFLHVQKGTAEISAMHEKLYAGLLRPFYPDWLQSLTFLPHMTVGRFEDDAEWESAANKLKGVTDQFQAVIDTVYVEIINLENDESIIELSIPLK